MKKLFSMAGIILLFTAMAFGQLGTTNPTNNVNVNVAAEAALTIAGDATLSSTGTNFADYTGTTNFTYFIRTGAGAGSGSINLKVTTDFSPAGGPSVSCGIPGLSEECRGAGAFCAGGIYACGEIAAAPVSLPTAPISCAARRQYNIT